MPLSALRVTKSSPFIWQPVYYYYRSHQLCVHVYKCLRGLASQYLSDLCLAGRRPIRTSTSTLSDRRGQQDVPWFLLTSYEECSLVCSAAAALVHSKTLLCQCLVFLNLTYLDLVPPVLIRTLSDELSPSGTVVGSISRVIRINTQCVQIFLQCVLPCPLCPPPATFWSPHYGQTSWSGCRESQDVPNKSSSLGGYCVMQCSLSSSCHHFVICDVVAP